MDRMAPMDYGSAMPANTAAWIPVKRARLEVKAAPYTPPGDDEIVVRNHAVAINPVDWMLQAVGDLIFGWIKYPAILGSDLAGEVVEVGLGVTRFKVGDRVLGHAVGQDPKRNRAAEGAFQAHTVVLAHMAAPIPDAMAFENAAVIPLGLSTAACGLFQKDHLALHHPTVPPRPRGRALIIWGGSTSVGSNAIQLAVAAGYEVFTTASPRNFDYAKALGASQVFDYKSKTVVAEMIRALKGRTIAGALAIGATSAEACVDIVHRCEGARFVSIASYPLTLETLGEGPGVTARFLAKVPGLMVFNARMALKTLTRRIRTKFIFGSSLMANEVGPAIYVDFLPRALADGQFVAAPQPRVVGTGLTSIQGALDIQRQGVSASTVVVSLAP